MKKFMVEMVKRAVEKGMKETCFDVKLTSHDKYQVNFTASTVHDGDFHDYKGFIGLVGQVVITEIDGKRAETCYDMITVF